MIPAFFSFAEKVGLLTSWMYTHPLTSNGTGTPKRYFALDIGSGVVVLATYEAVYYGYFTPRAK